MQPMPDSKTRIFRTPVIRVHNLPALTPLLWLWYAWQDMRKAPLPSLFYGLVFALMGWLLRAVFHHSTEILLSLTTTFALVGPFLALGLYEISRQLEYAEKPSFPHSLTAWRNNFSAISFYSLLLIIVAAGWMRLSAILYALLFTRDNPPLAQMLQINFLLGENLPFIIGYFFCGAIFAAIVFAFSVVAVPMMLEKDCDTITAMLTSAKAVRINPTAMLLWAFIIVAFTLAGLVTAYIGLIFTMPLIGHASWHAYRALVDWRIQKEQI